jgi:predicted dienelactone hydrolase
MPPLRLPLMPHARAVRLRLRLHKQVVFRIAVFLMTALCAAGRLDLLPIIWRRTAHVPRFGLETAVKFRTTLCMTALALAIMSHLAIAQDAVGVRRIAAPANERGTDLDVTVWYPTHADGDPVVLGETIFFMGTPAIRDAPIAGAKLPVILLSHGAGLAGNAEALSWIATPLARQGFVVVAPTHPGNSGKSRSAAETMKIWMRPSDLTQALDAIETNAVFQDHLEPGRVGVLGLSMGGSTALAIAGARIDPTLLAGYCDTDAQNASLCEWVRQSGVDLHAMDMRSAGRDSKDGRIRFAMAIDPAPVDVFDRSSFARISTPIRIINLGAPSTIPATVLASGIARLIANAAYSVIEDAHHFSMFAECKPGAAELAKSEKIGDPICTDGGGRSRSEIHAQLIEATIAAFSEALKSPQ